MLWGLESVERSMNVAIEVINIIAVMFISFFFNYFYPHPDWAWAAKTADWPARAWTSRGHGERPWTGQCGVLHVFPFYLEEMRELFQEHLLASNSYIGILSSRIFIRPKILHDESLWVHAISYKFHCVTASSPSWLYGIFPEMKSRGWQSSDPGFWFRPAVHPCVFCDVHRAMIALWGCN